MIRSFFLLIFSRLISPIFQITAKRWNILIQCGLRVISGVVFTFDTRARHPKDTFRILYIIWAAVSQRNTWFWAAGKGRVIWVPKIFTRIEVILTRQKRFLLASKTLQLLLTFECVCCEAAQVCLSVHVHDSTLQLLLLVNSCLLCFIKIIKLSHFALFPWWGCFFGCRKKVCLVLNICLCILRFHEVGVQVGGSMMIHWRPWATLWIFPHNYGFFTGWFDVKEV